MNFTQQDLDDYESYEEIRASGAHNMFSPEARQATGLSRDRYLFVMENFSELREASKQL